MKNIKTVITIVFLGVVSTVNAADGVDFNQLHVLGVQGSNYAEPQAQNGYSYYRGYDPVYTGGYNYSNGFCSTPQMNDWYYNRGYYNNGSQNYWGRYYDYRQPTVSRETWTYQRETYGNNGYYYGNNGYYYGNNGYYYGNNGYYDYDYNYGRNYRRPNYYSYNSYPYFSGPATHGAGLADGISHIVHGSRSDNGLEVAGGALTTAGNILNLIGDFRGH